MDWCSGAAARFPDHNVSKRYGRYDDCAAGARSLGYKGDDRQRATGTRTRPVMRKRLTAASCTRTAGTTSSAASKAVATSTATSGRPTSSASRPPTTASSPAIRARIS
jgi:hypothetical protein